MTWIDIFIRIADGEKNIPSPFDKNGMLNSLYVIFDLEEKIGYLQVWCSVTHKGILFSRVGLPGKTPVNWVLHKDLDKLHLPNIILQDINTFTKEMEQNMLR